jgi:hypothetical protein
LPTHTGGEARGELPICQFGKIPRTVLDRLRALLRADDLYYPQSGCGHYGEDGGHSQAAIRMFEQLRLAIRRPNESGSGSEEENMSNIALSQQVPGLG